MLRKSLVSAYVPTEFAIRTKCANVPGKLAGTSQRANRKSAGKDDYFVLSNDRVYTNSIFWIGVRKP